ncbi:MAG TPA: amino acid adenylation domain-containing protein [Ideonella sp.]|uniref:non-ribosomal peptide synthetase n=1 Tax=Ideonella sp. TaxID=1929293 RepID=UPI002E362465|nr:amino acid adenylation domain-containing protein [Ideonella sp.]HEX5686529.1 amino acid adenylation domain-containing protein [Ideonella sp.]
MSLGEILQTLRLSGVTLALDGSNGLRVQAPKGAFTPALRDQLAVHKQELVRWLQESQVDDGAPLPQCTPEPQSLYEPFPLSDLQMGFYMADDPYMEFHVRPHYYIEKQADGLDVARYEAAWNKALRRHSAELVTVTDDGLLQTVRDPQPLVVQVNDWRSEPASVSHERLAAVRAQMMRSELPIDRWPWLDVRVSLWSEDGRERCRIHYNHNNFFSDGYGTTRLLQEVDRYHADPALELPPLTLSFRDAALALDRLAASDTGQAARRYWEERLPAFPEAVPLPLRAGMNKRCRSRLNRREGFLDAALWRGLKEHAREAGLTPSSAVFAAYAEVLAAWSNSRHFLLSNMMTRRLNLHPEMRGIVGNFASLYPLEVDLRERKSFSESAVRLQEQVSRDSRHTHWGGMRVMQALNHGRHAMGSAPVPFVIGSGLFMDGFERSDFSCLETSQVMLDHQFWELPDGCLYYVWDLLEEFFPDGLIDAMWQAYADFIEALATDAGIWRQADIDLLPQAQREQRRQPPVDPRTVPSGVLSDLVAAMAGTSTDAVVCAGQRFCHSEVAAGAGAIAHALRQAGVGSGERIAIVADRGLGWLQAVHAVQLVGSAHVPIDPTMPTERCAVMLADCGAAAVLCSERLVDRPWPRTLPVLAIEPTSASNERSMTAQRVDSDSLAYIIYTSGSTGRPKGVMIDHRGVINTVRDINGRFGVQASDRLFGVSSIGFDLSVYDVFGAADAGAALVFPDPDQALNPSHWLDLMQQEAVTIWNSAPPLAALLADAADGRGVTLPALRLVMLSGDWIPLDLPDRLRRIAPAARIVSLGGATEASIWSILYEIEAVEPSWASIPYGRPMENQRWHVLDDRGLDVPVWTAGDLYIGGIGLAQGYWNDRAKTEAAFKVHGRTGERLYRTGDCGRYLPDGTIEFLGRRDAQVKVQGYRIELGEVEAALAGHPGVAAGVVVAHGGGPGKSAWLAAYVVRSAGAELDAARLSDHLATTLPKYMVPSRIAFLPQLPLSANGKIDRRALQSLELPVEATVARAARAPGNEVEAGLLELWSRVLRRDIEEVGHDFFELGGQSFEAVRLVGLVKERFGTRLSLGDIWEHRTVDRLAALVQGQGSDAPLGMRLLSSAGTGTPLYLVHPAGGHVLCYRHFAAAVKRPVRAFEAPGVSGQGALADSVEALASLYVAALNKVQPSGPVMLGGWSSGGPIAFEMAAQLRRVGRTVERVVLVDTPAPAALPAVSGADLLAWFVEDLNLGPQAIALTGEVAIEGSHAERLERVSARLRAAGLALTASADELAPIYRTFEAVVLANRAYRAPRIDVELLILRADAGCVSEFALHPCADELDWGWRQHTSGQAHAHSVSGTHHSLLEPPTAVLCADIVEMAAIQAAAAASARRPTPAHPVDEAA